MFGFLRKRKVESETVMVADKLIGEYHERPITATELHYLEPKIEDMEKDGWECVGEPTLKTSPAGVFTYWSQALRKKRSDVKDE